MNGTANGSVPGDDDAPVDADGAPHHSGPDPDDASASEDAPAG
jgi:hypothetical protein